MFVYLHSLKNDCDIGHLQMPIGLSRQILYAGKEGGSQAAS